MSKIKYVTGDILTPCPTENEHIIMVCHQVNCMGAMGSGLAKQIHQQFPAVYTAYPRMCVQR